MHAIASILALSLSLALGSTAVAAPTASSSVEITANVQFNSILGGSAYGVATLSGDLSGDELGALRGTVNLPLHDEKITVEPTGIIVLQTQQLPIQWQRLVCQPFFCYWETGTSTYERKLAQGPVDLRFGNLRGNGTLSVATDATCISACPPPGAFFWGQPMGQTQITGGVTSSQDAGTIYINGAAPVIH